MILESSDVLIIFLVQAYKIAQYISLLIIIIAVLTIEDQIKLIGTYYDVMSSASTVRDD